MDLRIDPELRALIPALSIEERAQLEANILADGCRDPLVVWHSLLLDGHNRYEICQQHGLQYRTVDQLCADRDDAKIWIIRNQFGRRNLAPFARAELALQLEPLIAAKAKTNLRTSTGGKQPQPLEKSTKAEPVNTRAEVAKAAGVSDNTIAKAKAIVERAPEPIKEQLRRGDISINKAYQDIRSQERREDRIEQIVQLSHTTEPLSGEHRFPVIYADPPWRYEHVKTESRAIENQYPTMTLDAICALPLADVTTEHALLFLWATSPKLADAMRVIESWGFTYRTSMVWVKDQIGMGYYARQRHELLLIATKGEPPVPAPPDRPDSVVMATRAAHSEKPEEFYAVIERMYPTFQKIELFARNPREGWVAWGNQAVAS